MKPHMKGHDRDPCFPFNVPLGAGKIEIYLLEAFRARELKSNTARGVSDFCLVIRMLSHCSPSAFRLALNTQHLVLLAEGSVRNCLDVFINSTQPPSLPLEK